MTDRFSIELDSTDYHVLYNAVQNMQSNNGVVCEIGTRKGGSLVCIIDSLINKKDYNRNIVSIDPYGEIHYRTCEDNISVLPEFLYANTMRNETMVALYNYVLDKPLNLVFFNLEDTEFFSRFHDGIPFYNKEKTKVNLYSLVFFDGPHHLKDVLNETFFFLDRIEIGSVFVYDDITNYYDHNVVETVLFREKFQLLEKTDKKASYIKT